MFFIYLPSNLWHRLFYAIYRLTRWVTRAFLSFFTPSFSSGNATDYRLLFLPPSDSIPGVSEGEDYTQRCLWSLQERPIGKANKWIVPSIPEIPFLDRVEWWSKQRRLGASQESGGDSVVRLREPMKFGSKDRAFFRRWSSTADPGNNCFYRQAAWYQEVEPTCWKLLIAQSIYCGHRVQ